MFGKKRPWEENLEESAGARDGEAAVPEESEGKRPTRYRPDRSTGIIPLCEIIPDPNQPRKQFDEERLRELAESLKAHGQLQAIRVRWEKDLGKYVIISGERRFRASQLANLEEIRCEFVTEELSDTKVKTDQLVENLIREDLQPIEEAQAYQELMTLNGWNGKELAAHLSVSVAKVSRSLSLLKLPEDIQEEIKAGELPATAGHEIAKQKGEQAQRDMVLQLKKSGESKKVRPKKRKRSVTDVIYRTASGAKVQVLFRKKAGLEAVREALDEVAGLVSAEIEKESAEAA